MIIENSNQGSDFHFHWRSLSIEIVLNVTFEPRTLLLGKVLFQLQGKSILRNPFGSPEVMYVIRTMFAAFLIAMYRSPANFVMDSAKGTWELAGDYPEISPPCLDGRSVKLMRTLDLAVVCWKNVMGWWNDVPDPDEYEMSVVNRMEFIDALISSISFLNQFYSNIFDCQNLKWISKETPETEEGGRLQ